MFTTHSALRTARISKRFFYEAAGSPMPRYFFDVDDGSHFHDNDGVILNNPSEIEIVAVRALADITRDRRLTAFGKPLTVTVRDEAGAPIYHATMTVQSAWSSKPE